MITDPILLVDDEPDLRLNLVEALTQDGYPVVGAEDVAHALALMAERPFPVVITDLNMPGGPTGFDLIQAIKASYPLTLCVVITGFASMETAIQAVKFGAFDFLQKPFRLAEIEAVLDRALEHATLLDQFRLYREDLEDRVLARVRELQEFHEEVLKLNDLLVASQRERSEEPVLEAFLAHLRTRFDPAVGLALLPAAADAWAPCCGFGAWTGVEAMAPLPPPSALAEPREWAWREDRPEGRPEGHLIPLRSGGRVLGAICLGFEERNGFHPEDSAFVLWRRQLEAALYGLRRPRDPAGTGRGARRPEAGKRARATPAPAKAGKAARSAKGSPVL